HEAGKAPSSINKQKLLARKSRAPNQADMPGLEALKYSNGKLTVLDQLKLPLATEWIQVKGTNDAWDVIKKMQVRGAPLIAMIAMLSLAIQARSAEQAGTLPRSSTEAKAWVQEQLDYLCTSRPTAVNLFNAAEEMMLTVQGLGDDRNGADVVQAVSKAAEAMLQQDIDANRRMGKFGVEAIKKDCGDKKVHVLTHCNTGSLATAGYGTALGVIRALQEEGSLAACYATETRPYNQGSRLTAYEMVHDGLPGTLITDSMVAALAAAGKVDAIVTGADRVVSCGDTANKIGTMGLAVIAKHFGIPFYIVAPTTTMDMSLQSGDEIVIEERPGHELLTVAGQQLGPKEINVWNPAFDVTPAALITAIVTDEGVVRPGTLPGGERFFDLPSFLHSLSDPDRAVTPAPSPLLNPPGYRALDTAGAAAYLAALPEVAARLGISSAEAVTAEEVGDGNLNLVFICKGPKEVVVLKQALPYVRCVGEGWPLSLDRAHFEHAALVEQHTHCPQHTPEVFHFNRAMGVIVMAYIKPPHIILRKGLIAGKMYPTLAKDMGEFIARTLFFTSGIHLSGSDMRKQVARWSANHAMCELTEQVVFTDPYTQGCELNHWTTPHLDSVVASIQNNTALKLAVAQLKQKFLQSTESLIHGDLHSGSVMVMERSTVCIDPEFAFCGPMGFDLGAIIGNLLLAYCSQRHHSKAGSEYPEWLLQQVEQLYESFKEKFLGLWASQELRGGYVFSTLTLTTKELGEAQEVYMRQVLRDSLGFAGAKMIRRIIGIAHVEDFESIQDDGLRAPCELHALEIAQALV
ncbi:unnamed protein product, partial [Chrysoparadoxa australica]